MVVVPRNFFASLTICFVDHSVITLLPYIKGVRAGKRLTGVIEIESEKMVPGEELTLTISGKENSSRKSCLFGVSQQHEFYKSTLRVCDLKGTKLRPGKSRYSFIMDLPKDLPSSTVYRVGSGVAGFNIQYKLSAKFGVTNKTIVVAIAAAKLEKNDAPFIFHPATQLISSVHGSKQGSITYAATVQNTNLQKGEELVVALACCNDSSVIIQRVEIKVVELLNWGSREGYSKSSLFKETLVKEVDVKLPGLQRKNSRKTKIIDACYRTVETQSRLHAAIRDDLVSGRNTVKLEVPFRSRDTVSGTLIDIRHYIKIKFVTNGFGSGSQPSIKIPIHIGLPEDIPTRVFAKANVPDSITADDDLAEATPVPSNESSSKDYHQCKEEGLREAARRQMSFITTPSHQSTSILEAGQQEEVELDLGNLVPMLPPSKSSG